MLSSISQVLTFADKYSFSLFKSGDSKPVSAKTHLST